MTQWVSQLATGWNGQRPSIRGEQVLSGQVMQSPVASTDRESWIRSRHALYTFALRDFSARTTEAQAARAASVALVLLANESAWGRAEWRWNACGMHCAGGDLCMRFSPEQGDTELRAYENIGEAAYDFWRLLDQRGTDDEWAALKRGELAGLLGVWRRGVWSNHNTAADLNAMLRRIKETLGTGAGTQVMGLDPSTDTQTRSGGSGEGDDTQEAPVRRVRRRGGAGLLILAAVLGAVALSRE